MKAFYVVFEIQYFLSLKKHYFLVSDLQVLTRNALRDVSQDPALCALLRRAKPDDRLERLAKLIEKLKVSSGF